MKTFFINDLLGVFFLFYLCISLVKNQVYVGRKTHTHLGREEKKIIMMMMMMNVYGPIEIYSQHTYV